MTEGKKINTKATEVKTQNQKAAGTKSASTKSDEERAANKRLVIIGAVAVAAALAIAISYKINTDKKAAVAAQEAAEDKAATEIENDIKAIGTVTLDSEPVIASARTAYDSAETAVQGKVDNYDMLTKAEEDYSALKEADEADAEAAKAVDEKKLDKLARK